MIPIPLILRNRSSTDQIILTGIELKNRELRGEVEIASNKKSIRLPIDFTESLLEDISVILSENSIPQTQWLLIQSRFVFLNEVERLAEIEQELDFERGLTKLNVRIDDKRYESRWGELDHNLYDLRVLHGVLIRCCYECQHFLGIRSHSYDYIYNCLCAYGESPEPLAEDTAIEVLRRSHGLRRTSGLSSCPYWAPRVTTCDHREMARRIDACTDI